MTLQQFDSYQLKPENERFQSFHLNKFVWNSYSFWKLFGDEEDPGRKKI